MGDGQSRPHDPGGGRQGGSVDTVRLPPPQLRRRSSAVRFDKGSQQTTFTIDVDPPFRLDLTVWALRRRSINQIDRWNGSEYERTICLDTTPIRLTVRQVRFGTTPRLLVRTTRVGNSLQVRHAARDVLDRVLGLRLNLSGFYQLAAATPPLGELALRFMGMRPPRFPSTFEALVNGVANQQISLQAGLTLLNRLTAGFGRSAGVSGADGKAFPAPDVLAATEPDALMAIGFSRAKSIAIKGLAIAAASGAIGDEVLAGLDDAAAVARLDQLRGVGRWTAEYVLLRGCGRLNIFPGDDVGARNNLQRWLGKRSPLNYESTGTIVRRWQPYAGLVYLHLLLKHLDEQGMLSGPAA